MTPSDEHETHGAAAGGQAGEQDHRGDKKLARQLLKPRRRAQIEVWLDETVSEHEMQYCTAGRGFGHRSDSCTPQPKGQPGEGLHSTPLMRGICPVCGRPSEGEQGPREHPLGDDPPPRLMEGKAAKYMLRGIRSVMGQFRAKDADDEKKGPARAVVSTAMFLAQASGDDDSSVATVSSWSGRFGGGEGKALEERMARLMRAQKLLEKSQARG